MRRILALVVLVLAFAACSQSDDPLAGGYDVEALAAGNPTPTLEPTPLEPVQRDIPLAIQRVAEPETTTTVAPSAVEPVLDAAPPPPSPPSSIATAPTPALVQQDPPPPASIAIDSATSSTTSPRGPSPSTTSTTEATTTTSTTEATTTTSARAPQATAPPPPTPRSLESLVGNLTPAQVAAIDGWYQAIYDRGGAVGDSLRDMEIVLAEDPAVSSRLYQQRIAAAGPYPTEFVEDAFKRAVVAEMLARTYPGSPDDLRRLKAPWTAGMNA